MTESKLIALLYVQELTEPLQTTGENCKFVYCVFINKIVVVGNFPPKRLQLPVV